MNDKNKPSYTIIILVLTFSGVLHGQIKLPAIISDNIVLQQKTIVPIWGWADPGEKVAVKGSWQWFSNYAKADNDGKWKIMIKTPKAGGPYTLTIKGNDNNIHTLNNILIGEVWVCSGQSNMWWPLEKTESAAEEIANANYPQIRFFDVPPAASPKPSEDCGGKWQTCTPKTIGRSSAVAYYFGNYLHQKLNVPVGLIEVSWGGTPAEAWTKREVLINDKKLCSYIERDAKWESDKSKYEKEFEEKISQWKQDKQAGKAITAKPEEPLQLRPQFRCSYLYNGMIKPIIPFAIKGVIWYQGEGNSGAAYLYRKLFPAMIQNWRDDWGQGNFPFYFVQLANFCKQISDNPPTKLPDIGQPSGSNWAELREAQLMTLSLPKTGMAVTMDIGEPYNIHPKNKRDVGKRLALWALSKDYGFKNTVYSGPIYEKMIVEGNKIRLYFNDIGSGLIAQGNKLEGFSIAAKNQKFVWADAVIEDSTVVVSSKEIDHPVAVRYGWANWIQCNLFNKEGLPASPFRTDDWPGITMDKIMW
jgi:sialate O-acetylesterase